MYQHYLDIKQKNSNPVLHLSAVKNRYQVKTELPIDYIAIASAKKKGEDEERESIESKQGINREKKEEQKRKEKGTKKSKEDKEREGAQ